MTPHHQDDNITTKIQLTYDDLQWQEIDLQVLEVLQE